MNTIFKTLDEANLFIDKANSLLSYPDGKGTETYSVPTEVTETTHLEDGTESTVIVGYSVEVTQELNELLIGIAIKQLTNETTENSTVV